MTFYFPDVSSPVTIEPGTVMVCAKKTHGSAYLDGDYVNFKGQSAKVGAKFFCFHWLNHGNIAAQVAECAKYDLSVPVMIDAEDVAGNTGFAGFVTVEDIKQFALQYRAKGGICNLYYLPHWYWQSHMGSPDLRPLRDIGLHLVSSNYTSYSDNGPGWAGYGGVNPEQWQYTDNHAYGGGHVDFNAVKGYTVDQWWSLISAKEYGTMASKTPDDVFNFLVKIVEGTDEIPGTDLKSALPSWVKQMQSYGPRLDAMQTQLNKVSQPVLNISQEDLTAAFVAALKQMKFTITPD